MMLYLAFVRAKPLPAETVRVDELSRRWWNEGERPAGLKTIAIFGSLGTTSPDVFVFDTDTHGDIQTMVSFWSGIADLEVHPAVDLADAFRRQGMDVA
jgi:hypothetical protein